MQPNYRYVVEKLSGIAGDSAAKVLDYGCGKGDIVQAARERGFQAYGVEKFYGGSNIRDLIEERGLMGDVIRELDDDRIPFDDDAFDLVVSNQVFEHIPNLESAVAEIARVLKSGGLLLCLFPSKGVVREVHCGIPIVHWLPKKTRARYYWLLFWRCLGFGYHKENKSRRQWATDFHQWLNDYTHYRSRREVGVILNEHFDDLRPLEDDYVAFRFQLKGLRSTATAAGKPMLRPVFRQACRLYGGLVLLAQRR